MDFSAKVITHSISPANRPLITAVMTYPRFIHSEVLTHRDRARNSASSRAIPWEHPPGSKNKSPSMKKMIQNYPVIPIRFGSEQKGMKTGQEIEPEAQKKALRCWLNARDQALNSAQQLANLGVHKSIVNRLTEPFMWITIVMTASEWNNFFRLRDHEDAEIHFQKLAGMLKEAIAASQPTQLDVGQWHLPFIEPEDWREAEELANGDPKEIDRVLCEWSTARCARVSYLTHEGERNTTKDKATFDSLVRGSGFGHWSPMEHQAQCLADGNYRSGPFRGWMQFRKLFTLENLEG